MNKKIYVLVAFLTVFLGVNNLFASHVAGMELTYTCLGNDSFQLELVNIRACESGTDPTSFRDFYVITSQSLTSTEEQTDTLFLDTNFFQDITPVCLGVNTKCTDDASAIEGYAKYIYRGVVHLPSQQSDWRLMLCDQARNNSITTLVSDGIGGTQRQSLCIYVDINNVIGCNNSPVFNNNPVSALCVGTELCINNSATDIDGDSLVYEIVEPLRKNISNNSVYLQKTTQDQLTTMNWLACDLGGVPNAFKPFCSSDSIEIGSSSGIYCVKPSLLEVTIVAIRVKEYRAGQLIGTITRDMQIKSYVCNNKPPTISDLNGSFPGDSLSAVTDTTICPGLEIDIDFTAKDEENQIMEFEIQGSTMPVGASLNIINNNTPNPTLELDWTPGFADTSAAPYCFTLNVSDKDTGCSFFSVNSRQFCFTVDYDDQEAVIDGEGPFCEDINIFLPITASPRLGDYLFSGRGITDSLAGFYNPFLAGGGKDTITFSYNYGFCSDTVSTIIQIDSTPVVNIIGDTTFCRGNTIALGTSPIAIGSGPFTYEWVGTNLSCDTCEVPMATPTSPTTTYTVSVTSPNNCVNAASVVVTTFDNPLEVDAGGGDNDQLCTSGGFIRLGGSPTAIGASGMETYTWTPAIFLNDPTIRWLF